MKRTAKNTPYLKELKTNLPVKSYGEVVLLANSSTQEDVAEWRVKDFVKEEYRKLSTVISWPASQICRGCFHSEIVFDDENSVKCLMARKPESGFCSQKSGHEYDEAG